MHKHNNNLHYGVTDIRHTNKQINRPQIETNNDKTTTWDPHWNSELVNELLLK